MRAAKDERLSSSVFSNLTMDAAEIEVFGPPSQCKAAEARLATLPDDDLRAFESGLVLRGRQFLCGVQWQLESRHKSGGSHFQQRVFWCP